MRQFRPSQITPSLLEIGCEASGRHRDRVTSNSASCSPFLPGFAGALHDGPCRREEGPCPLQFLQEMLYFCFTPEPPSSVMRESLFHEKEAFPCPQPIARYCPACTACVAEQPAGTNFFFYLYKMSDRSVVGVLERQLPS